VRRHERVDTARAFDKSAQDNEQEAAMTDEQVKTRLMAPMSRHRCQPRRHTVTDIITPTRCRYHDINTAVREWCARSAMRDATCLMIARE